jgi:hypothetical protein
MKLWLNRLNWKLASSLLLLTLVSGCLYPCNTPRSGEVHGRVLDAVTREPIQGAKFAFIEKPYHAVFTDADGLYERKPMNNFHLLAVPPEGWWPENHSSLTEITHPGYSPIDGDWNGSAADILLKPAPKAQK